MERISFSELSYIIQTFQRTFHWQKWEVSEDEKNLLITHDTLPVFRHSTLALYTVLSLEDR